MNLPDYIIKQLLFKLDRSRWYRGGIKACCPFHDERTPSCSISEAESGIILFYCFGCGASGTINRIFKRLNIDYHIDFDIDKRYTKNSNGVLTQEPYEVYRLNTALGFPIDYDYFIKRGISVETCQKFDFRFCYDTPAAVFPVWTCRKYLGYIKRHIRPDSRIRYEIEPGLPIRYALWGFDMVDKTKPVYITEGIIDAAIYHSAGLQAIALCNKTWEHKLPLLSQLEQPICVPDNYDPQSYEIFNKIRQKIGGRMEYIPLPYKDVGDFILDIPHV